MSLVYGEGEERLIFRFLTAFFVFCKNRAQSLYMVTVFPSLVQELFFSHFTSILQKLLRLFFSTIAIRIYLCFAGELVFRFHAFGFISYTIRVLNKTSFLWKRLVVKK